MDTPAGRAREQRDTGRGEEEATARINRVVGQVNEIKNAVEEERESRGAGSQPVRSRGRRARHDGSGIFCYGESGSDRRAVLKTWTPVRRWRNSPTASCTS